MKIRTFLFSCVLVSAALLISGCSAFDRDWNQALKQPAADHVLAGAWSGEWNSHGGSHTGGIRCLVNPTDTPDTYRVRFSSTYGPGLLLRHDHEMTMKTTGSGKELRVQGNADLGIYGQYEYDGQADGQTFESRYTSKAYTGNFRMARPR